MKRLFILSVVTLLAGAGSSIAQDVRYDFDKNTDFSKFKTYNGFPSKMRLKSATSQISKSKMR
jgi:hypothetical protein